MKYQPVIGLEVHVQLKTDSKLFCSCSTKFGASPNSQACPVCTGMPGVLPVLNRRAVEYTIKTALALNCKISDHSIFARKNYFYPDLPKNYQISQYELPLAIDGHLEFDCQGEKKRVGIVRIHMEEDAGKLMHFIGSRRIDGSLVDFNRTGVPLMEIVSSPEMYSSQEAYNYLVNLKAILEYLDVSDCNMEEGSLRCDANVSVRPFDKKGKLGVKTEVKNMNSFKAVEKALQYEIDRQIDLVKKGKRIKQDTRLWDEKEEKTSSMRSKEEAHDYRYFPEPDLIPLQIQSSLVEEIRKGLPELPQARKKRLIKDYGLSEYMTGVLVSECALADYFEECMGYNRSKGKNISPVSLGNWVVGDLLKNLHERGIEVSQSPVKPGGLVDLLGMIDKDVISGKIAKTVFDEMFKEGKGPQEIVKEKGLVQIADEDELGGIVDKVLEKNQKSVSDFKSGKDQALKYLVGQVMKETKGRANPQMVNKILEDRLKE